MGEVTRTLEVRPPFSVSVTSLHEAIEALHLLNDGALGARDRAVVIATVVLWIEEREREIRDIELGATRLLLQAAQALGERRDWPDAPVRHSYSSPSEAPATS